LANDGYKNTLAYVGIDILLYNDDKYVLIHCKHGHKKVLTVNDLAGFFAIMIFHETTEGRAYYANKLSTKLKEGEMYMPERIKYIKM